MQIAEMGVDPTLQALARTAQDEPVMLRQGGRDVAVVISLEEYAEFREVNLAKLIEIAQITSAHAKAAGLTEEKLAELLADES